ncbi:MAG TPA: carbamoyltransferase HypF, partial [Ignavibacteria bacterium]|nr:carbamoyltransferase HypF [Ignavibacteria bacterium]
MKTRAKITIHGVVQGVGFRPFVYRLANDLGIKGWIINSVQGVFIDAEGSNGSLEKFICRLKTDKPKNSFIQSFEHTFLDPSGGFDKFEIRKSKTSGTKTALVLPDIATCDDCISEIFDPSNRRYLYPFTNCTNCGPRFTIINSLPYDRKNTAMAEFEMCPECYAEYINPSDRRFHAEPIACPECGPQVELLDETGYPVSSKHLAIINAAELIKKGKIIALKGIGGYQLIADARNSKVIIALRTRKRRNEKPFALMFPDINSVKAECEVNTAEENLLCSAENPIVLLRRKRDYKSAVAEEAAINNPYLGIMLPYSPLHHILMHELNIPVIATSGNLSEEPICIDEKTAFEKLSGIADFFLIHNRKILRHVDDSIARVIAGREMLIRRARGYAPLPVQIDGLNKPVLAAGAHLKNTIAINNGSNVFISQHIGDLENIEAINAYGNVISDMEKFYEIKPEIVVADLHPDYISTKYSFKVNNKPEQVQHHYAHVLSCMAENNLDGEVLGVSWDGTGYGTDGTIWGSEFLVSKGRDFVRAAHLKPFRLPGGEIAIHEIWRIGFALLYEVYGEDSFKYLTIGKHKLNIIRQMIDKNINSPVTTSMGRLFDGIASILNIRQYINFEAQGAMELEFEAM